MKLCLIVGLGFAMGCGGGNATVASTASSACEPFDAGPCYVGWATMHFVECDPGASPPDSSCIQDDTAESRFWCCPN
jgi:hypothetical protein